MLYKYNLILVGFIKKWSCRQNTYSKLYINKYSLFYNDACINAF